jgi:hypothetical protein
MVHQHPLFAPLATRRGHLRADDGIVPAGGWAMIDSAGTVHVHPTRLAPPEDWAWVFAHLLLHLGLNHHRADTSGGTGLDAAHLAACEVVVTRFQSTGSSPATRCWPPWSAR